MTKKPESMLPEELKLIPASIAKSHLSKMRNTQEEVDPDTVRTVEIFADYWFKWMGWLIILGVLDFARTQDETSVVTTAYWISWVIFFFQLVGVIGLAFSKLFKAKEARWRYVLTAICASFLALLALFMATAVSGVLAIIEAGS